MTTNRLQDLPDVETGTDERRAATERALAEGDLRELVPADTLGEVRSASSFLDIPFWRAARSSRSTVGASTRSDMCRLSLFAT